MIGDGLADLSDGFGHWFAGFVDGEGCFLVVEPNRNGYFVTRFSLKTRADDLHVLQEIQERCGFGNIQQWMPSRSDGCQQHPVCELRASSQRDCARIVEILRRYPLRAKKRDDFEIWCQAVEEVLRPAAVTDHKRLRQLATELSRVKKYSRQSDVTSGQSPLPVAIPFEFWYEM